MVVIIDEGLLIGPRVGPAPQAAPGQAVVVQPAFFLVGFERGEGLPRLAFEPLMLSPRTTVTQKKVAARRFNAWLAGPGLRFSESLEDE